MAKKKFLVATFDDEKVLFPAIEKVQGNGNKIHDVYTPFPIHGLDHALGLKETKLHVAGFIYGMTGTITAVSFMTWVFTKDWKINFGGKPFWALPAFIPITFELTVLFAAVGMVLTFCYLCQIMPGVKKHHFHPRATDDLMVMVLELNEHNEAKASLQKLLKESGAKEIDVQEAEESWWFGRYDKDDN